MKCWFCHTELIWGGDQDVDDDLNEEEFRVWEYKAKKALPKESPQVKNL